MNRSSRRAGVSPGTLFAACAAIVIAQVATVVPAPIVGIIRQAHGLDNMALAWVTSAFLLPTAVLALTFGLLGDRFGRKYVLMAGAAVVAVGEIIAGAADGVHQLWIGQAVTGVGAGALIPTSLAIAVAGAPTALSRSRGVATWTMAMSLGTMIGVLYGSALNEYFSWHASFYGVAPLALVSLVITTVCAEDSREARGRALDWPGQISLVVGLTCLLYGLVQGMGSSWKSPSVLVALPVAAVALLVFAAVESRSGAPMLRFDLFRDPAFATATVAAVIGMFSFLGSVYALSIRLGFQQQSATDSAVFFVVLQGLPCLLGPALPRLMDQLGARLLITGGLALLAAGEIWLAFVPLSRTSLVSLTGPLLLEGVGFLFVVSALTAAALNSAAGHSTGMTSAAVSAARNIGTCLGPAVVGAVALHNASVARPDHLWDGYATGLLVCAAASVMAAFATLVWFREPGARPEPPRYRPPSPPQPWARRP
ncbi:MFS transporter [Actinocorallia populi]|uniref:MFS transporter n=1 Tax=Actinocorallia populi TaxID=2079200 RepID=UPI0013004A45|nr:MFS transporter [Actinocorallia populi]